MTIHKNLTNSDLHAPWRIFADNTARLAYTLISTDLGKMFFVTDRREFWTCVSDGLGGYKYHEVRNPPTWCQVTDTLYTEGSPRTLSSGVRTKITNNAGSVIDTLTISSSVWNNSTNKILAEYLQDSWLLRLDYRFKPSSVASGQIVVDLDIGGAQGIIAQDNKPIYKGSGVEQRGFFNIAYYQLATFLSNGGDLNITVDVPGALYGINFVFFPLN